jgi:hypothetical protein
VKYPSTQNVNVKVVHRLAGAGAVVDYGPVTSRFDSSFSRKVGRHSVQMADQSLILFSLYDSEALEVLSGQHQQMNWRLRVDILDGHAGGVFIDNLGRSLAPDDFAEDAVVHSLPFRRLGARLSRPLFDLLLTLC